MFAVYRKFFALLDSYERRRFYIVLALLIFVGISELVGISSVMILMKALTDAENMMQHGWGARIHDLLGFSGVEGFRLFMAASVVVVFFLSLLVRAAGTYASVQFASMRGFSISVRLLQIYLHRPYTWFLQRNTADLRKMVLNEVNQLVWRVLIPGTRLLSNLIVSCFILGFLLILNPLISMLAMVLLGGGYLLIYLRLRRPLYRIGHELLEVNGIRFRLADEATGGFKEVKLKGIEDVLAQRFHAPAFRAAELMALQQLVLALPRFALEGLGFAGIVTLIFVLYLQSGGNVAVMFPTLSVFAFATVRLLPALQQVFQGVASIRGGEAMLDQLHYDLVEHTNESHQARPDGAPSPVKLRKSIELRDLSYSYEGAGRPTLHGLSLNISALSSIGLVGGTGAGKTTLVDLVLGLLEADTGEIRIDGEPLTRANRRAWQARIGYVPQSIYLTDDTITHNIAFGVPPDKIDMEAVKRAARMAVLHDFIETELDHGYDTIVGERGVRLSGGQRQRIGIARALYADPDLLVMDEATSALDTLTEHAVMDAVRNVQGEKTIILIAHRLSTVRDCDCIFMLEHGQLVATGTYDELVARNEVFRQMAMGG